MTRKTTKASNESKEAKPKMTAAERVAKAKEAKAAKQSESTTKSAVEAVVKQSSTSKAKADKQIESAKAETKEKTTVARKLKYKYEAGMNAEQKKAMRTSFRGRIRTLAKAIIDLDEQPQTKDVKAKKAELMKEAEELITSTCTGKAGDVIEPYLDEYRD